MIVALISVAPPTHHYDFHALLPPSCPWLVLMGDQDEVVPLNEVVSWAKSRQSKWNIGSLLIAVTFSWAID